MPLTTQQLYDRAARHLLTQRRKAINKIGDCRYRAPNGLKCAIGAVIPDSAYRRSFEDCQFDFIYGEVYHLFVDDPDIVPLGVDLQDLHDEQKTIDWPWALLELGHAYHLDVTKVTRKIRSFSQAMVDDLVQGDEEERRAIEGM